MEQDSQYEPDPPATFDAEVNLLEHEVAERWRVSLRTMQRWRAAGIAPPHLRVGRRVLYPRTEVVAFEARRRKPGRRD